MKRFKSMYLDDENKIKTENEPKIGFGAQKILDYKQQKQEEAKTSYSPPNMGPRIAGNDKTAIRYGNYNFDPNTDYMALMIEAEKRGDYNAAQYYENMRNAKINSGFGGIYQPTNYYNYKSEYGDKINELRRNLENYEDFNYSIEADDNYKNLANVYHKNALEAQKNALAQAAAANGGRLSSNAIIAASLGYGNQMNELEAEIPGLRQAAYNMYLNGKNDLRNTMNDYINAENMAYSRWNDDFSRRYGISRDLIADIRDERNFDYSKGIDERNFDYSKGIDERNFDYTVQNDNREFELKERQVNSALDSALRSDAVQESLLIGKITPSAAEVLGVPEGTPTYEALNNYYSRQLQMSGLLGVVPDSIAKEHGFEQGGDTLDKRALDENIRINSGRVNYGGGSTSGNYNANGSGNSSGKGDYSSGGVDYGDISTGDDSLSSAVDTYYNTNMNLEPYEIMDGARDAAIEAGYDEDEFKDELAKLLGVEY